MVRPLAPSSAATLFVARAEAISADFELTAENASAISAICTLLDGLPLAIELAAARSAVLPPETLLTRLLPENTSDTDYLKMLRGSQDRPVRQQTLRNTIDWSYDLLDPAARTLFTHLSVFAGGCTLEAIEAICLPPGPASSHVSPDYLLDHLTMLVDHHLVQRSTTTHPPRFSLLETMYAYAQERLLMCDEAEVMQERHATFYRMLALAAEPHLQGRDQLLWLDQVEHERANLRAATRWLLDHGRSAEAVTLIAALDVFWILRGGASEAEQWLRTALAAALPPIPKAAAMTILGLLRMLQHDGSTPIKGGWARKGLNKAGSCGIFSERDDQIASGETPREPADPILPQSALSNKRKGW